MSPDSEMSALPQGNIPVSATGDRFAAPRRVTPSRAKRPLSVGTRDLRRFLEANAAAIRGAGSLSDADTGAAAGASGSWRLTASRLFRRSTEPTRSGRPASVNRSRSYAGARSSPTGTG